MIKNRSRGPLAYIVRIVSTRFIPKQSKSHNQKRQDQNAEVQQKIGCLLGSKEGKEHVERNLDGVNEDKTVLGGDEFEVDSVDKRPHLPGSLHG